LCCSMSVSWCKSKPESPSVAEIFIELLPINKQVSSAAGCTFYVCVCHTERAISCMGNWGKSAWCVSQLTRARINTDKRLLRTGFVKGSTATCAYCVSLFVPLSTRNVFVKEKTQCVCFHLLFHVSGKLFVGKIKQMLDTTLVIMVCILSCE
jgi:hypothetical protein